MNIMVFDTETTNLEKPFCYNIGYVIYDTESKTILSRNDFVVEQVWHNPMLFTTAYYSNKRELYVSRLKGRTAILNKFGYITQQMYRDIKHYEIQHAYAFNSPFDTKVFEFNCEWFKCINPFDTVQIHDIRGQVHRFIAFTKDYQDYCEENKLLTESENYSTTAETVYKYLTQDKEFIEEHTALADSLIELEILKYCIEQGGEWETDYKVYTTIPRNVLKEYIVVDSENIEHHFYYTTKRKLKNQDGVKLTIKNKEG